MTFLLIFSLVGFYISLYFTLVYLKIVPPSKFPIPKVCRLTENSCQLIIETKYARLLGLPNFYFGLAYYLALILFAILKFDGYIKTVLVLVSWFAVAIGVYLSFVLLKILKVGCILCFISHAINFFIALFLSLWK